MLVQRILNFYRVDIFAAGDEHILFAVADVEVPLLVILHDVAGVEPALVVNDGRRGFGIVPVAGTA